ncbi:hypothetical protein PG990_001626 [Apiospora arundinis]|uniref:Transcription factor Cys6 n=1 Tax=Apiospora arundinis TaxID=335852 RepID=A0ABR2HS92_9PEZI
MLAGWRSIKPKPEGSDVPEVQVLQKPKRIPTKVACVNCRTKKRKCDGGRPGCGTCKDKKDNCIYDGKGREAQIQKIREEKRQLELEKEQLTHRIHILESFIKSRFPAGVQTWLDIQPKQQPMGSVTEEPFATQSNSSVIWPRLPAEQEHVSFSQYLAGLSRAQPGPGVMAPEVVEGTSVSMLSYAYGPCSDLYG